MYSITTDENVTVGFSGTPTEYETSCITAYKDENETQLPGLKYGDVLYAGNGDEVSLTLGNTPPEGFGFNGYTTTGGTLTGTDNPYTLTMPDADVEIGATYEFLPNAILYLDMNGQQHYCVEYTTLDGSENDYTLTAGWYVADGTINFAGKITVQGNVHLILKDGAVVNVDTESDYGIGVGANENYSLSIYAQSTGANKGQLHVYGSKCGIYAIKSASVNINGGQVTATGSTNYGIAINSASVNINGGQVTATGDTYGIYAYIGSVTLGWTNATDFIHASSYKAGTNGSISIAAGKTFITEDDDIYSSGTLSSTQLKDLKGKTLYPQGVVFKQVAGYGEGSGGWVFIASPVAGSIAPTNVHNLVATPAEDFDLYYFDQTGGNNGKEWKNWKPSTSNIPNDDPNFNLVNGQGYLYATKYTKKLAFGGTFITSNEPVEVPLDYDADQPLAGWNLVGNPFTVEATMTDGDNNPVSYYVISGQTVAPYEGTETTIEPFTGVMVKAEGTGESVYFTKASSNAAPQPNNGSLHIALTQVPEPVEGPTRNQTGVSTSSTTLLDNAIVSFNEGSQLGKFYFGEQNGNIYIPQGAEEYAIAYSDGYGEMPVNFRANENGQYTISVNPEGVEMSYLHLIDNMTGADVDLLSAPEPVEGPNATQTGTSTGSVASYTFTARTTDYESRFKLVFVANDASTGSASDATFAFMNNGNWIIANDGDATLQVIDLNGRILSSESIHGSVSKSIHAAAGVYMLRLINGDEVRTQKIVVR